MRNQVTEEHKDMNSENNSGEKGNTGSEESSG